MYMTCTCSSLHDNKFSRRRIFLACPLLCSQCPVHSRCSINICDTGEAMNKPTQADEPLHTCVSGCQCAPGSLPVSSSRGAESRDRALRFTLVSECLEQHSRCFVNLQSLTNRWLSSFHFSYVSSTIKGQTFEYSVLFVSP